MGISANDLRAGDVIIIENNLMSVEGNPEHIKPGKGPAYVQVTLRNLENYSKTQKRLKSSDNLEKAYIDSKTLQYLYSDQSEFFFMDINDYNQITVPEVIIENKKKWLFEGLIVEADFYEDKVLKIVLPTTLELEIINTEPHIKGATVTGSFKKAVLSGNINVLVPQYLSVGEKIVVKTECGSFVRKVQS